jgi:hypothetical protein
VTVTAVDVVWLPAASRARAVRVCVPLAAAVVSQEMEYGDAVSSAPRLAPSRRNCTPATPTLSEALADTVVAAETVAPLLGAVMLTVGAEVSAVAAALASLEAELTLPAASWAVTL